MKFSGVISTTTAAVAWIFSHGVAAAGTWSSETITVADPNLGDTERSYQKYIPDGGAQEEAGVVVFFHGQGGSSSDHTFWNVEYWADEFKFLALVPDGSSSGGGGGGGGPGGGPKKARRLPPGGRGFGWNIGDTNGINEVLFIQEILGIEYPTGIGPKIAFGFSGGAGMASLQCCYNSLDLFVAHVGCLIDDAATFSETCSDVVTKNRRLRGDVEVLDRESDASQNRRLSGLQHENPVSFNVAGLQDELYAATRPELYSQLASRAKECVASQCPVNQMLCNDSTTCPVGSCFGNDPHDVPGNTDFNCYTYPGCDPDPGQLCIYPNLGHAIDTSMAGPMYSYLASSTQVYNSNAADGGGGGGGGSCTGECGGVTNCCNCQGKKYCKD